ncbi:MAG TPA: hypothetical protein PKM57_14025 [Kiritimatiellia bacterium]|nr:hypothetical protein [Kiritimatiellia bacterium]HPS08183.1 hypothetical protein [Kiritimatiellia bacterium]
MRLPFSEQDCENKLRSVQAWLSLFIGLDDVNSVMFSPNLLSQKRDTLVYHDQNGRKLESAATPLDALAASLYACLNELTGPAFAKGAEEMRP